MIRKTSLWRTSTEEAPVFTVCSTEKFKNGLQPFMDEDENIVTPGVTHFETYEEAVQFVVLNKQRDIEALRMREAVEKDKVAALGKAIKEAEIRLEEYQKKVKRDG